MDHRGRNGNESATLYRTRQPAEEHFVYTEGVRSSSLLPPKAFQDRVVSRCYSRAKIWFVSRNREKTFFLLSVRNTVCGAGKWDAQLQPII